ncbi:unnamed protein product [Albugo candida]|uniref:Uncharacterized protein n=1 Tax=Albugo candida TaxID=65357 RepID=A0A024GF98_9STRA|nr:unnamed protein product [Albugo candida]|eukprot:CCI45218.1 unnamed protein product [Albugo candida]
MLQLNEKGSLTRNPCDWWSSFLFPTPNVWKPRFSSSSKYLTAQLSPIEEAILPSGLSPFDTQFLTLLFLSLRLIVRVSVSEGKYISFGYNEKNDSRTVVKYLYCVKSEYKVGIWGR